eukprot:2037450-Pleurochrysis_carterae.AAC.1
MRERSEGRGGRRERRSESLGSEARALRKYACDAIAKRQTVHVSGQVANERRSRRQFISICRARATVEM